MYRLIDRAEGLVLGLLSDEDFDKVFAGLLVEDRTHDSDYFVTSETLATLAERGLEDALKDSIAELIGDSEGIELSWERGVENPDREVEGRLVDGDGKPLVGYKVEGWDKDLFKPDDFLGWAFTRHDGHFTIGYRDEDYKDYVLGVDVEGDPEVYLRVFDSEGNKVLQTAYRQQTEKHEDWKEIVVELPKKAAE